jgi:uncharacterized membrane protein YccC
LLTLGCVLRLSPGLGPGTMAVVLCISLSRSQLDQSRRGRVEAALALPVVALAATGVGLLLHRAPWLGAAVFVAGMGLSIWLRRFGPLARRAGSLIALPFVVLLTTPYLPPDPRSPVPALLMPVLVALLAFGWVSALHALARRLGWLPEPLLEPIFQPPPAAVQRPAAPAAAPTLRPIASTRMALQMVVALALSFAIGYGFFAERWAWIVLTAFIVLSGNRGRLDVAYKSLLRVLGAAAGTVLALSIGGFGPSGGPTTVAAILLAVFLGLWLRPLGYGWWALFVTLALALLQRLAGEAVPALLWPRLQEIVIGALIGLASAWFVLPVRSTAVLRRRLADALAALSEALSEPPDPSLPLPQRQPEPFIAALAAVEQLAPAFRASRRLTRRLQARHPADWVDALADCRDPALALIGQAQAPAAVRRAVGAARKALREPDEILAALQTLRTALASASGPASGSAPR